MERSHRWSLVQYGFSQADLMPLWGTASRVSEVLTGKRELSMTMVRKLRERFHIPPTCSSRH
jgi:HTH-type transcriptional regulator/antitoxin HigA